MSSMSNHIAPAARSLGLRTLHLKVNPTPRTFAEQREVLRVIERFGEVSVFKSLKYDPHRPVHNAFIAVYNSASSARDLQNASPLRYRLITESSDASSTEDPESNTSNSTVFELNASETTYNHYAFLKSPRMNPLHGPYVPATRKSSYKAASLSTIVPDSNWSEGVIDWDTEKSRWHNEDILAPEEETLTGKHGESGERWIKQEAILRKQGSMPGVMGGLQRIWREKLHKDSMQRDSIGTTRANKSVEEVAKGD
ncbi:hypothetical protein ONS95_005930 [Cadophora gregata]|uniref:uncharacterized protein n=1 Tax=Cadophora gregata TaxID=51156 RepID=UPI0026DB1B79|nr:uncharacterized protein ONS95_005930 [Cadophora gregata]KAK0102307.1 hypothetical protein ONS95_005930 [Cadophora gregata]KAK0103935.1 hypothetical protein ONS96_005042 [Cadophora gregata f. sp. sojae]